jgi:hypothetical protein
MDIPYRGKAFAIRRQSEAVLLSSDPLLQEAPIPFIGKPSIAQRRYTLISTVYPLRLRLARSTGRVSDVSDFGQMVAVHGRTFSRWRDGMVSKRGRR